MQRKDDTLIFIYYFDTLCKNGFLVKDSDKCYAKFYFKAHVFMIMTFCVSK